MWCQLNESRILPQNSCISPLCKFWPHQRNPTFGCSNPDVRWLVYGPLTRYVKLQVAHAPGTPGTFSPRRRFQRKPLVSDPGIHHGTCVTHVPWYMSGSLTCGDGGNVPSIPGASAPAILRIWQEAHVVHRCHHKPRQRPQVPLALIWFNLSYGVDKWLHPL